MVASIAFSGIVFAITFSMIRWLGPVFIKAGLKGRDMAKPRKPEMYVTVVLGFSFLRPFGYAARYDGKCFC